MTELQKAQDQLNKALAELMKVNLDENELLYDYIFEAHRLVKKLTIPHVVKRYRVEAIAINKKELYNEIFESKQKAEELYQVLLIKYHKTYTSVKMTEL